MGEVELAHPVRSEEVRARHVSLLAVEAAAVATAVAVAVAVVGVDRRA